MFYYKLGQMLLQIEAAYLLQNGAGVITNWGKLYYKLGQLLQVGVIITNWGITPTHNIKINDKYFAFFIRLRILISSIKERALCL